MTTIQLADHQLPELARLIATELRRETSVPAAGVAQKRDGVLVDAGALAAVLGVSRSFVYQHAAELGAERLGDGPKPRLRFDVQAARAAMARSVGERSLGTEPSDSGALRGRGQRGRARLPLGVPKPGSVLQIRGEDGRGGRLMAPIGVPGQSDRKAA
jgi:hypothetical protein